MTDAITDKARERCARDGWRRRRIGLAAVPGAGLATISRALDFWPMDAGFAGSLRAALDLSRLFLVPTLATFLVGLAIAAALALVRRGPRRAASCLVAIVALPAAYLVVARVPLFDPWAGMRLPTVGLSRLARSIHLDSGCSKRWMSTGSSGIDPNHFVLQVYDESGASDEISGA